MFEGERGWIGEGRKSELLKGKEKGVTRAMPKLSALVWGVNFKGWCVWMFKVTMTSSTCVARKMW